MQQTDASSPKFILADRFKTKMCKNHEDTGVCPYESRCMFAHGEPEMRTRQMNLNDNLVTEEAIKAFQKARAIAARSARRKEERRQRRQVQRSSTDVDGVNVKSLDLSTIPRGETSGLNVSIMSRQSDDSDKRLPVEVASPHTIADPSMSRSAVLPTSMYRSASPGDSPRSEAGTPPVELRASKLMNMNSALSGPTPPQTNKMAASHSRSSMSMSQRRQHNPYAAVPLSADNIVPPRFVAFPQPHTLVRSFNAYE